MDQVWNKNKVPFGVEIDGFWVKDSVRRETKYLKINQLTNLNLIHLEKNIHKLEENQTFFVLIRF